MPRRLSNIYGLDTAIECDAYWEAIGLDSMPTIKQIGVRRIVGIFLITSSTLSLAAGGPLQAAEVQLPNALVCTFDSGMFTTLDNGIFNTRRTPGMNLVFAAIDLTSSLFSLPAAE